MEPIASDHRDYGGSRPASSTPAADQARAVALACERLAIDSPQARAAVARAYDISREYLAPVVVKAAAEMVADLRPELARDLDARVVFLGRNGGSLEAAIGRLAPDVAARSSMVAVSRQLVERAMQDHERTRGERYEGIDPYRDKYDQVAKLDVTDSKQRLDDYLEGNQVPISRPDSNLILIDSSFKGSVQEQLSAMYPAAEIRGRYLFFGAHPDDPHPGTKQGYAVHLTGDLSTGTPVDRMPEDVEHTFAHQDAIAVFEDTLHGTLSSPDLIDEDGTPRQSPVRFDSDPLRGFHPHRVVADYHDPAVREAVLEVMLAAVADRAGEVRDPQLAGRDWQPELARAQHRAREQIRNWVTRDACDPQLASVLDSFVRRGDKRDLATLSDLLRASGVPADRADQIWQAVAQLDDRAQRREFVESLRRQPELLRETGQLAQAAERLRQRSERLGQVPEQRRPVRKEEDRTQSRRDEPPADQRHAGRPGPTLHR